MANNVDECANGIIQAMENLFDAKSENLKYDKTYKGKVINIVGDNTYTIAINGANYTLQYKGTLNIGDVIRVKSPMNNFSEIYIEPISTSGGGEGASTNYNVLNNKPILDTSSSTGLQSSSSEIIVGTVSLHKISKTGSYNDLLNKPDLSQYLTSNNIVNNVTSESTTDALSAKQGKTLNAAISANTSMIDTLQDDLLIDEQDISDLKDTRLTKDNIIAGTNISLDKNGNNITINASGGTAPVQSVNSKIGEVVLTSDDINVGTTSESVTSLLNKKLETANLKEGDNITLSVSGNDITISSGGGTGITKQEVEEMISGKVLYSVDPFSAGFGDITLSDDVTNYQKIVIEYNEYSYSSHLQYVEIYNPSVNKNLDINWIVSSRTGILMASTTYVINSETVLHPSGYMLATLSSSISRDASRNFIGISKVIGYKY